MQDFKELPQLPGTPQEQAWLTERLKTLSAKESIILSAALMKSPAQNAADAINHIVDLPDYEVCSPAGSYAQLGTFYMRYESDVPRRLQPYIDMEKAGRLYEDDHPGIFVGNCYVQYPTRDPTLRYDGTNLEKFADTDWSVKLLLASDRNPNGVWMRLPDYSDAGDERPDETRLALDELGVDTIRGCRVLDAQCILPQIGNLMLQYGDLTDLIYDGQDLGFALGERGQGMQQFDEKLRAALEYTGCHRMDEALDVIQNLHYYDIVPAYNLREYAICELEKQGSHLAESALADCFDYDTFAADLLEQRDFILTEDERFYVGRNEHQFIREHSVEPLPSLHLE